MPVIKCRSCSGVGKDEKGKTCRECSGQDETTDWLSEEQRRKLWKKKK